MLRARSEQSIQSREALCRERPSSLRARHHPLDPRLVAHLHAGVTAQEVAAWLGDTLAITLQHYAHAIEGLKQERAGVLGAAVTGAANQIDELRAQLRVVQ